MLHVQLAAALDDRVRGVRVGDPQPEAALVVLVLRARGTVADARRPRPARGDDALELVDRPLRVADLDGVQLAHRERHERAAVHGVAVQFVARGRGDVEADELPEGDRVVRGDERVLGEDAVRPAALQPDQVAPVVQDREVLARDRDHEHAAVVGRAARPMWCVAYGTPEQKCHVPLTR